MFAQLVCHITTMHAAHSGVQKEVAEQRRQCEAESLAILLVVYRKDGCKKMQPHVCSELIANQLLLVPPSFLGCRMVGKLSSKEKQR